MYNAVFTPLDADSPDREAALIYNRDRLVAIAKRLIDPSHQRMVGFWHIVYHCRRPDHGFQPFANLNALIRAIEALDIADQRARAEGRPPDLNPTLPLVEAHPIGTAGAVEAIVEGVNEVILPDLPPG